MKFMKNLLSKPKSKDNTTPSALSLFYEETGLIVDV